MTLQIRNLHVEVDGKEILHGVSVEFKPDEIHALMGPNGSGKTTLAHAIMGNPKYKVTSGTILLDGKDVTKMSVSERAKAGLFLSFQYPAEVQGVSITHFLRTIVNNQRKEDEKYSVVEFHKIMKEAMKSLSMDTSFLKRNVNEGFSGGEKKRMEMLQLLLLQPRFALLDETDSGLDVDAIRVVAEGIVRVKNTSKMGVIVITHYNRFLEFMNPDTVTIIQDGKIIKSGGPELATEIDETGFTEMQLGETQ